MIKWQNFQVVSTNPRFCKVAILGVESTSLKEPFKGTIRKEDVRATEKDKVEMYKSFRPGDIVLARVLTLHTQTYLLSTAENELGVIFAKSDSGKTNKLYVMLYIVQVYHVSHQNVNQILQEVLKNVVEYKFHILCV